MTEPLQESGAIAAASASREGRVLAHSILGTVDPEQIIGTLDAFCAARLGSKVEEALFCELSVGATFGLRLGNGRRVMLKAHQPDRTAYFLEAVCRVQRHLYERGFPCPEPIAGPLPLGRGFATVEAFVDDGERMDAHETRVRCEMARTLARLIELAAEVSNVRRLAQGWTSWRVDALWPTPHNALFDFEATAQDAGWIDEIAARARETVDNSAGRVVVGHSDWSVKHFRFDDGEVRVIYDWDSLRLDKETVIVGTAAATFAATWYLEVSSRAPSPDEMRCFIHEYEVARGRPFSIRERQAVAGAATYVMAYSARCEHAVDTEGRDTRGSFREALSSYGDDYMCLSGR